MSHIHMNTLSFELTRRCNLKCSWCCKGDSQNLDITPEIIDKTLDEIQGFSINQIGFFGGEPLLNPDMIEYLADQIIIRKIKVNFIQVVTNATVINPQIRNALYKLSDYCLSTKQGKEHDDFWQDSLLYAYQHYGQLKGVHVRYSTYEHDNIEKVEDFVNYYSSEQHSIKVLPQDYMPTFIIEGYARDNWKNLPTDYLKRVRIIDNRYCIIDDSRKDGILITKTIQVGANGIVGIGATRSYENWDKNGLFNVLECNNDFYERIDQWCWNNPNTEIGNRYKEYYLGLLWKIENNIINESERKELDELSQLMAVLELYNIAHKKYHRKLPYLNHYDIEIYTTINLMKQYPEWREIFSSFTPDICAKDILGGDFSLLRLTYKNIQNCFSIEKECDYYENTRIKPSSKENSK